MINNEFSTRDERGFVVVATLLALLLLVSLAVSGLTYTTLETRSTAHFDTGNQAFAAAESGLLEALSTMNRKRVTNFQTEIVNQWTSLYGTGTKAMIGFPSILYQVSLVADATAPANRGTITVTGYAPLSAKRVLSVAVNRSGTGDGIGAIYIAADAATSTFNGNAFLIDGNNHTTAGALTNDGVSKPAIATYASQVASNVIGSLSTTQQDNVVGQGFSASPLTPSVSNSGGPSVADLSTIAQNVLALGGVVTDNIDKIHDTATYGTLASPQITHLTSANVRINGNMSGAGILVADGNVTIQGSMEFVGWILALGTVESLTTGNATIYGSLWTSGIQIQVGGSAIVGYCSNCLNLADGLSTAGALPRTMEVSSWQEVL